MNQTRYQPIQRSPIERIATVLATVARVCRLGSHLALYVPFFDESGWSGFLVRTRTSQPGLIRHDDELGAVARVQLP